MEIHLANAMSSQCRYDGYTAEDFTMLLSMLEKIEGKFLLSSYDSPILRDFVSRNGWSQVAFEQAVSVNGKGKRKPKLEVMTGNYQF